MDIIPLSAQSMHSKNTEFPERDASVHAPSRPDARVTVQNLLKVIGLGKVLILGHEIGEIMVEFLRSGIDVHGMELSLCADHANVPERLFSGSLGALPFEDDAFDTVVAYGCLERAMQEQLPGIFQECYRVSSRCLYIDVATAAHAQNEETNDAVSRRWWETMAFEAGFRKHAAYYRINDYESLNREGERLRILLQKIVPAALKAFPLVCLGEERGLHMDMLRDSGERSDAHVIRYEWACRYIKPGDRVLDAASGLGYGSHLMRTQSKAAQVIGIDGSEFATNYANAVFAEANGQTNYQCGMLPEALQGFGDETFDVIVSFETLEHVSEPQALIEAFSRLLAPGGRLIVSVPNDWSDETGTDPNPYHLHVYTGQRLQQEMAAHFMLEDAYAQTASQCKVARKGNVWERRSRSLHKVAWSEYPSPDCEWWLMVGMKSPLSPSSRYQEKVFGNIARSGHPSIGYAAAFRYPWLMHAMVNSEYRLKDAQRLEALADHVISSLAHSSNDYAAALCVKAYAVLNHTTTSIQRTTVLLGNINDVIALNRTDAMGLRWRVSLLFVKGKLLQACGDFGQAKSAFAACSAIDVRPFGIHLATKTTEAFYLAGKLAHAVGDLEEAKHYWEAGVAYADVLRSASVNDILIDRDFPNLFNHGDGIREYSLAWDNLARCANGIHLLKQPHGFDHIALDNCHQTEYSGVTADLIRTRETLIERTELLEKTSRDLRQQTEELLAVRQDVLEHSKHLKNTSSDLIDRTRELVETRATLMERTKLLEQYARELAARDAELLSKEQSSQLADASCVAKTAQGTSSGSNNKEPNAAVARPRFYTRLFGSKNTDQS